MNYLKISYLIYLSNISIIEEANVAFLNMKDNEEEPESYVDFLAKTQKEILTDILGMIF